MDSFLVNILAFARLLRAAGAQVHHGRLVDVIRALEWTNIGSRTDVRATLRSLLVHRVEDLRMFDEAFDLFFRAHGGSGVNLPLLSLGERARLVVRRDAGTPKHVSIEDTSPAAAASAAFAVGAYSPIELSRGKDFAEFTSAELEVARRLLARMPWAPGRRRTRRWTKSAAGTVDLRRVLRGTARHGGEPFVLPRRARRHVPRPVVLIADVSGSMDRYSRILLYFAAGLSRGTRQVEAFLFATRLTRVTRRLAAAGDHRAMTRLVRDLQDWGGGTRIGEALRAFNTTWARRVMRHGPVVLIVSDGWDRGDPQLLSRELARVRRHCSRLVWLNPLLGSASYRPLTRGMAAALQHVDDFLPVHNLASVQELALHLRSLTSTRHGIRSAV